MGKIQFTKEDLQMENKYLKRCSASLSVRKMQMKPQWGLNDTLSRIAAEQNKTKTNNEKSGAAPNAEEVAEKLDHSDLAGGNECKIVAPPENRLAVS